MQRALTFTHHPPLSLPLRYLLCAPVFALLAGAPPRPPCSLHEDFAWRTMMRKTASCPDYQGPSMSVTVTADGHRIHRLADDHPFLGRAPPCVIRRDPMVAALFGATGAAPRMSKRAA